MLCVRVVGIQSTLHQIETVYIRLVMPARTRSMVFHGAVCLKRVGATVFTLMGRTLSLYSVTLFSLSLACCLPSYQYSFKICQIPSWQADSATDDMPQVLEYSFETLLITLQHMKLVGALHSGCGAPHRGQPKGF